MGVVGDGVGIVHHKASNPTTDVSCRTKSAAGEENEPPTRANEY